MHSNRDKGSLASVRRAVDFGSVYASKSFRTEDGRRVLLGWAFETAAGCVEQCSLGTNFTDSLVLLPPAAEGGYRRASDMLCQESSMRGFQVQARAPKWSCRSALALVDAASHSALLAASDLQGWQGAHTLPREVTLDAASNALLMNPALEVAGLRAELLLNSSALSLPSNATTAGLLVLHYTWLMRYMHVGRCCIVVLHHWPLFDRGCSVQHQLCSCTQDLNTSASASRGRQLEALVTFHVDMAAPLSAGAAPFILGLQLNTGASTHTRVLLNGTAAAAPNGSMTVVQVCGTCPPGGTIHATSTYVFRA